MTVGSSIPVPSSKLDKRSQISVADKSEVRDPKEVLTALPCCKVSMSPGHAEAGSNHTYEHRVESTMGTSGN